jgi:hypothetical protein
MKIDAITETHRHVDLANRLEAEAKIQAAFAGPEMPAFRPPSCSTSAATNGILRRRKDLGAADDGCSRASWPRCVFHGSKRRN